MKQVLLFSFTAMVNPTLVAATTRRLPPRRARGRDEAGSGHGGNRPARGGHHVRGRRPRSVPARLEKAQAGYRAAFTAWLATHPLKNPHAPPAPSYLAQYRIPQEAQGRALDAKAETFFKAGQAAGATGDRYVRI